MRKLTKSHWAAIGLTGMDSGEGKGDVGSSGVCEDQRCVSCCVSSLCIDVHVLVRASMGENIQ